MPIASPEDMAKVAVGAQHLLLDRQDNGVGRGDRSDLTPPADRGCCRQQRRRPDARRRKISVLPTHWKSPAESSRRSTELRRGLPGVHIDAQRVSSGVLDVDHSIFNLTLAIIAGAILVVSGHRRVPVRLAQLRWWVSYPSLSPIARGLIVPSS